MQLRVSIFASLFLLLAAVGLPAARPAQAASVVRLPFAPGTPARIIQGYSGGTHTGVDPYALDLVVASGATSGAPVVSPVGGTITWSSGGPRAGNGCLTIALSGGGHSLMMCHVIFDRSFTRGERVAQGQRIGTVGPPGTVGNNGTAHVHLDLRAGGAAVPFATGRGLPLEGVELPPRGRANDHAGTIIPSAGAAAPAAARAAAPAATPAPARAAAPGATGTAGSADRTTAGATSSRGGSAARATLRGPAVVRGTEGCLNVRSAPGLAGRRLGCLPEGTWVTVVGGPETADGQDWYLLGSGGWAAGSYLAAR